MRLDYHIAQDVLSCPEMMAEFETDLKIIERLSFPKPTNAASVGVYRNTESTSRENPLEYRFQFLNERGEPIEETWVYTSRIFRSINFYKTWDVSWGEDFGDDVEN